MEIGLWSPDDQFELTDPDGGRFTVDVPHAFTQCWQDLEPCWYQDGLELTVLRDFELDGDTWRPGYERVFTLPFESSVGPRSPTKFALWGEDRLAFLDTESGDVDLAATYEPRDLVGILPSGGLLGYHSDVNARIYETAAMDLNTVWEPLVEIELSDSVFDFLVGEPNAWYLVTGARGESSYEVYSVGGGERTLRATGDDFPGSLWPYGSGRRELEEGHLATVVGWTGEKLRLSRLDLDTAESELLDEVAISGLGSVRTWLEYPIACGGMDVLVINEVGDTLEYWVARLMP